MYMHVLAIIIMFDNRVFSQYIVLRSAGEGLPSSYGSSQNKGMDIVSPMPNTGT